MPILAAERTTTEIVLRAQVHLESLAHSENLHSALVPGISDIAQLTSVALISLRYNVEIHAKSKTRSLFHSELAQVLFTLLSTGFKSLRDSSGPSKLLLDDPAWARRHSSQSSTMNSSKDGG